MTTQWENLGGSFSDPSSKHINELTPGPDDYNAPQDSFLSEAAGQSAFEIGNYDAVAQPAATVETVRKRVLTGGVVGHGSLDQSGYSDPKKGTYYARLAADAILYANPNTAEILIADAKAHTYWVEDWLLAQAASNLTSARRGLAVEELALLPWHTSQLGPNSKENTSSPAYKEMVLQTARIHILQGRADRLSGRNDPAFAHAIDARRILDAGATNLPGYNNAALSPTDRLEISSLYYELATEFLGSPDNAEIETVPESITGRIVEGSEAFGLTELQEGIKRSLADIRTIIGGKSWDSKKDFCRRLEEEGYTQTFQIASKVVREGWRKYATTMRIQGHKVPGFHVVTNELGELQVLYLKKFDTPSRETTSLDDVFAARERLGKKVQRKTMIGHTIIARTADTSSTSTTPDSAFLPYTPRPVNRNPTPVTDEKRFPTSTFDWASYHMSRHTKDMPSGHEMLWVEDSISIRQKPSDADR